MGAAFFLAASVAALAILGAIGEAVAVLLGAIDPWEFC
jgi:hypothetical protein